jgi:hypothetical protein
MNNFRTLGDNPIIISELLDHDDHLSVFQRRDGRVGPLVSTYIDEVEAKRIISHLQAAFNMSSVPKALNIDLARMGLFKSVYQANEPDTRGRQGENVADTRACRAVACFDAKFGIE